MEFAWDEGKRQANLVKHGIDFDWARQVFDGRPRMTRDSLGYGEERLVTVARIDGVAIAVVWTWRDAGVVRIISARRARREERRELDRDGA